METSQGYAETLRRPRLLIRAARAGMLDYNRNRDLRRLMHGSVPPPEAAVRRLAEAESELEAQRQSGDAGYSLIRHVELLIALLAELRLRDRAQKAA